MVLLKMGIKVIEFHNMTFKEDTQMMAEKTKKGIDVIQKKIKNIKIDWVFKSTA
jgi:hypothetical protein